MATELEQLAPAAPNAASPARRAAVKGRRKAAVLLISLGTERAAQVFKHLRDDEIEALSLEMAKLQRVDPDTSESVLEELAATVTAYDSLNAGGVDYAREVLERALGPERAVEIIGRLSTVIEMPSVRVPAQDAARADRHVPAQRVAADDRAGDRQPAHHACRAGARAPARAQTRPRSRCGSRAWARHRRTSSSRSRT